MALVEGGMEEVVLGFLVLPGGQEVENGVGTGLDLESSAGENEALWVLGAEFGLALQEVTDEGFLGSLVDLDVLE